MGAKERMGGERGRGGIAVRAPPYRMKCGTSKLLSIPSSASTHFGDCSCWHSGKLKRGSSWTHAATGFSVAAKTSPRTTCRRIPVPWRTQHLSFEIVLTKSTQFPQLDGEDLHGEG